MTDAQVDAFLERFDEADKTKKGRIDFPTFKPLLFQLLNTEDERAADIYFRGIDIDNSQEISRDEFKQFVTAALAKDRTYTVKLIFRAFDKDRNRKLSAREIKEIGQFVEKPLTDDEIRAAIKAHTGNETGSLTFPQIAEMLTGEKVPDDADPYDGKLKSGCCLLL
jgi:Ca2+-binding EF-hand superfamily protein